MSREAYSLDSCSCRCVAEPWHSEGVLHVLHPQQRDPHSAHVHVDLTCYCIAASIGRIAAASVPKSDCGRAGKDVRYKLRLSARGSCTSWTASAAMLDQYQVPYAPTTLTAVVRRCAADVAAVLTHLLLCSSYLASDLSSWLLSLLSCYVLHAVPLCFACAWAELLA